MENNVKISVEEPEDGLFGPDELWITVTGPDPLPDYQKIRRLVREQFGRDDVPVQPLRYYPAWGGPDDDYEEMWVCRKVKVMIA